jgi:exodeoxyribonuclease V alpha subunit
MSTEQGIITAIAYNRSHTVAKLRIGMKKWAYVRTTTDLSELLGANGILTGEWHETIKGKYFLVENMDIGRLPAPEKVMEKVLRLIAKERVKVNPQRLEYNRQLRNVLTTLFIMGRQQSLLKFLKFNEGKQDSYIANPYLFFLNKHMDFYSAETLSQFTLTPQDTNSRIIAHAQHAVTLYYEDGKECVPITELANALVKRIDLPEEDIASALEALTAKGGNAGLKRVSDNLMLEWIFWLKEKSINMMFSNPSLDPPPSLSGNENLSSLLSRKMSVLSGRAGTGKTTLIKTLKGSGLKVAYAALTGKAASLLGENARTVHSLLGYRGGKFTVAQLDCDLLVVDEASMLNWHTLYAILKASPRTVFAGDPDQLPPVEGEAVFHKMLTMLPKVELTKTWRYKGSEGPNIKEIRFRDDRALLAAIRQMAAMLSNQGTMQVITPVNTGMLGVGNLNTVLRPVINRTQSQPLVGGFRMDDKVMCIKNVYCDSEIIAANGQVGIVKGRENGMLWVNISGKPVLLESESLMFAYCSTVHKVQGNEYDNVIFIVPNGLDQQFLTDNLMLVGKTRGREKTYVFTIRDTEPSEQHSIHSH